MNSTSRRPGRAPFLTLCLLAVAAAAGATAPGALTYQGRIKESGLPVTGSRTVDVQLCDALTGGSCVSTGAQGVSVANGLFRTTFTVPSGLALESGAWFVEVHVNGSAFSPREALSASAYSVYASSAATLIPNPGDASVFIASNVAVSGDGFSVGGTTFVVTSGSVGIGTASPGAALEVKGAVILSGSAHVRASGAGVAVPSVASCGTGAAIAGSDAAGRVTIGSGPPTSCQIVFGTAWSPNSPVCHFTNESGTAQAFAVSGLNSVSVTFTASPALNAGDIVTYICLSY